MKLRVQYTAQLRTAVGIPAEDIDVPEGTSLESLLAHLAGRWERAAQHLVTGLGRAQPSLLLVVNGVLVAPRDSGAAVLRPGDVVVLMPPIAGG